MTATSGPSGAASLRSVALQELLASRLRLKTEKFGSILYRLTWKHWDLPSGRRICALRASAARISVKGIILRGWPTTTTRDYKDGQECPNVEINCLLGREVWMTGWLTPTCPTNTEGHQAGNNHYVTSITAATQNLQYAVRGKLCPNTGMMLIGSCVEILPENQAGGPLSPEHSRWLMGLPIEWANCAPTEMRSISRQRKVFVKSSSKSALVFDL